MIHLTEPGSRHGNDEASNVAEVTHVVGLDQRQEDVVVLLALVLVHGGDLVGQADERIVRASRAANVAQQRLLSVVGRQNGDFVSGIACTRTAIKKRKKSGYRL